MKYKDFENYIADLSPELQEKARQCRNRDELNLLLAENDVELSEDALEAVAGGCSSSSSAPPPQEHAPCPECGCELQWFERVEEIGNRYQCVNPSCIACQQQWVFSETYYNGIERG